MKFETTPIPDVLVIRPRVFDDARGFFMEAFRADLLAAQGVNGPFVQDNQSQSCKGVVRGLHFQWEPAQGKLMRVTRGAAFIVAVDIRRGSPTLGKWHGLVADEHNKLQMWAPAGFARGFCALSEKVDIQYKVTGTYNARCESGILWNDPAVGIDWPLRDVQLSDKDAKAQTLAEWLARPESENFSYG